MNNSNSIVSERRSVQNSKKQKLLNTSNLKTYQNLGVTGSLVTLAFASIGEKTGCLKPETAKNLGRGALAGLCISTAPTVYKKVTENNLLENLSDVILKISTKAIQNI